MTSEYSKEPVESADPAESGQSFTCRLERVGCEQRGRLQAHL